MKKIKKFLQSMGPGFVTGASDDDPSGIATYSQTGAHFGYTQLWTMLFSLPFMIAIQEMCGRIGIVTGRGLSSNIRKHYGKPVLYFAVLLLLMANVINIGANLGAMASSGQLLVGIPFWVWLIGIALASLVLQVFVPYHSYVRVLKYLTLSLLAYVVVAFVVKQDWSAVLHATFVPSISFKREYLLNIVAILGTTISPYLFFWQTGEEVEEQVEKKELRGMNLGLPHFHKKDVASMRLDTALGMTLSNIIAFFIVVTAAITLGTHGITDIATASDAAEALRPIAGDFASLLFAVGIIGTGLIAVPVLAGSASYALAEVLGWREGLYRKFKTAHGFYGIIIVSVLIGLLINFTHIPPFKMLYYAATLNGVCAPPLMILILLISNSKKIMGKYKNKWLANALGVIITAVMALCALVLLLSFVV